MDTVRVLITGAGAPGIRGTLYSLKSNWDNRKITTIGVDMKGEVVGKYLCDRFYQVPPASSEEFIPTLLDICEREEVDVVLPQVTAELYPLARYKEDFEKIGTKVAVSGYEAIELANSKKELMKIAKKVGVPYPEFYVVRTWDELESSAEKLGFPFVVKPPVASGMRGFRIVYKNINRKEAFFKEKPDSSKVTMEELHNILGEEFPELLAMEYLPGREYSVDVLSSVDNVHVVVPRRRDTIRTGITFVGTVEKRDDLIEFSERLTLKIGLEYATGLQFKEDEEGIPKVIESNPRIQGTMVLSTVAGVNVIYGAVKLALGEELPEFRVRWGTRLLRFWGGVGVVDGEVFEI
ncbi:ATP-grasp domain-containing protein [Thermococcus gammatolerans]|uniref:Carbamoylphosphate synthase large subunit region, short form n=1 Tax=Thermococcus gammatolerans (strain DSM 15229 / JCM 11827 / EJ3) TaxID=593117 RepID=C5A2Z7_THEGJ|nr:ATP-grasp domain-containing protein [Thermococcus gammatolerans]ACS34658.1 Carbamoylphosphate synthase large subunit region, short form [Thermococcus gammatolerans EJ3]